jgi:glycosyltransferase involved in cell wall biosynthesis
MPHPVTMIGTLPPLVALSPYTKGLVSEVSKLVDVDFLGFRHIYPSFLFPGKLLDPTSVPLAEHKHLHIKNVLNWYNPLQWIYEALAIRTKIIHAQWWSYPLALIYITILGINRLRGNKIVLTVHNVRPHECSFFKQFFNKIIFHLGDMLIVHTEQNREELTKIVPHKTIRVIPHGMIEPAKAGISKEQARNALKIPLHDKVLLCFGHIRDYKGVDVAIRALGRLKDKGIKLLIAGKCWEDWTKYEQLINQFSLQDSVIKYIDYIPSDSTETFFTAADLVLLPYRHFDAQSGVGSLVLSFDIPMIVSQTGGLPNYVEDPHCVIRPDDDKDLATKIEQILSDERLYKKLQQDIITKKASLSWKNIAQQTCQIYQSLC